MPTAKRPDSEYDEVKGKSDYDKPQPPPPPPITDSVVEQTKAGSDVSNPQVEAQRQETILRENLRQQQAAVEKAKSDYASYLQEIDTAIRGQEEEIKRAQASGYFPVEQGTEAYKNLQMLKKMRSSAGSDYEHYLADAAANLKLMQEAKARLIVYLSQFEAPEYVLHPLPKYTSAMFSSIPTGEQGGTIQSPGGMDLFTQRMYKPIPGPALGGGEGLLGLGEVSRRATRIASSQIQGYEKFFGDIAERGAVIGADLFAEAEGSKLRGEDVRAGLFAAGTVAAGAATGVFDIMTFPFRPVMWGRTIAGVESIAAAPGEFFTYQASQFATNPLYGVGYAGGSLLGTRVPSVAGWAKSLYAKYAKKVPILNEFYYASQFKPNIAYPEFNIANRVALEYTGAGGGFARGAAKFWLGGVRTGSLAPFKSVSLFRNPLAPVEMPSFLSPYLERASQIRGASKLWAAGKGRGAFPEFRTLIGDTPRIGLSDFKGFKVKVSDNLFFNPLARDIRAITDIGKKFTVEEQVMDVSGEIGYKPSRSGRFTEIAPKVSTLPEAQSVGGSIIKGKIKYVTTPGGPQGMSFFGPTRSAVKFFRVPGVSTEVGAYQAAIKPVKPRSNVNRGFSMIDSGLIRKPVRIRPVKTQPVAETQLVESAKPVKGSGRSLVGVRSQWAQGGAESTLEFERVDMRLFSEASAKLGVSNKVALVSLARVSPDSLLYKPQRMREYEKVKLIPRVRERELELTRTRLTEKQLTIQTPKITPIELIKTDTITIQTPRLVPPLFYSPPETAPPLPIQTGRRRKKRGELLMSPQPITFETRKYRTSTPEMLLGKTKRRLRL